jgi:hypothetical protein
MAYVVATKPGRFEVRESTHTEKGPRSRTLVSFGELTDEVIEKAQVRAEKPPTAQELKKSALKVGAVVRGAELDEAARETLRLIAKGERPDPMLRHLLLDALSKEDRREPRADHKPSPSDAARSAAEWIGVGAEERAKALWDLLELTDALPIRRRINAIGFPQLRST